MINYLLNSTIIWIACLFTYDFLLGKETYHNYNRIYLNLTMMLGLLLPFWKWENQSVITSPTIIQSAKQAANLKASITTNIPQPETTINFNNILWIVYGIGVIISLVVINKEIIQLIDFYKKGKKIRSEKYMIVETGVNHSPFSIFNIIYVNTKTDFNSEQWQLLMSHEMEHGRLMHSIDKCLMLMIRVAFWFHPLTYLYYKKLMIVHEYQADAPSKNRSKVYGAFLLEQNLLQKAPILTHSFNYSPLKKRINMLTRKNSSKIRLTKYLVAIPLTIALIVCCTNYGFSYDKVKKGNKIYFKGNVFETNEASKVEVMKTDDPSSVKTVSIDAYPIKMNDKPIVSDDKVTTKPKLKGKVGFDDLIFKSIKPELDKLQDADNYAIWMYNIIIDEKGKLVYYDLSGLKQAFNHDPSADETVKIDPKISDAINKKIEEIFNSNLSFTPAMLNGKPVICTIDPFKWNEKIVVKNHVAMLVKS